MSGVKYPHILVDIVGGDGNAFAIMGKVTNALKLNHISSEEIDNFRNEAMSGDYNHLLVTVMNWINVGSPEDDEDEFFEDDLDDEDEFFDDKDDFFDDEDEI